MSPIQVHLTNGTSVWLELGAIGSLSASVIALSLAIFSENRRRADNRELRAAEARNVVILSWPGIEVVNAGQSPIRDVSCLGGGQVTTRYGTFVRWHCESELLDGLIPTIALLRRGDSHTFVDGEWILVDQNETQYAHDALRELGNPGMAGRIEWTDSFGFHWQRNGADEPKSIAKRTTLRVTAAR